MTFGEKLQKLRRESALSQEKLAEQLHVSRQAISKWELGTAAPDTDNIVRLSKFFQVPLEYLVGEGQAVLVCSGRDFVGTVEPFHELWRSVQSMGDVWGMLFGCL